MNKLPENFEMDRYGLHVRLVKEEDAEFILKLRTDPKLSRFIHSTDKDLEKQKEWIREYKKREKDGIDYYFLYENNGKAIGVSRIYNIDYTTDSCTEGSWICDPTSNFEANIYTSICARDIIFEILNANIDHFEVRKNNKQVINFHKMTGAYIVGESDIDFYFELNRSGFNEHKNKILKMLNL